MRLAVTGRDGQVATALRALAGTAGLEVATLARPDVDLARPETLEPALKAARPDVVVSAAAYTAVDQAEGDADAAFALNAEAAGVLAQAAARLGVPVLHLSTDYVFDGTKAAPYVESDTPNPRTVYGATKLEGERRVCAASGDHLVLRTAWVFAPYGKNFVRTMLRLAETRDELGVVADQQGCPSYAPDIAGALVELARARLAGRGAGGLYHLAGAEETDWAAFAEAILKGSAARGGPSARVKPITTSDYPTPAPRPRNSRLDCGKLGETFDVALAPWPDALDRCLDALKP
jgi:dTDP-4-dehydrorhamnose reductase